MRIAAAIVMVALGWALARDLGRFTAPALFRRMDPATAGTAGFLIRFGFLVVAAIAALRVAGLDPATLALGGAITAVVIGLAAQQTLGNLIAGLVLISVRPFKVGDRVRLQAGGLAGQVEGVVSELGLLYTTLAQGQDSDHGPEQRRALRRGRPAREPASVDLRARLRPDIRPSDVQTLLEDAITTPVRGEPRSRSRRSTPTRSSSASRRRRSSTRRPEARRRGPGRGRRASRAASACSACPRPIASDVATAPSLRWIVPIGPGASDASTVAGPQRQRRDVELGAVVLDHLDHAARDVLRRLGPDAAAGAWRRTRGTCPRRG